MRIRSIPGYIHKGYQKLQYSYNKPCVTAPALDDRGSTPYTKKWCSDVLSSGPPYTAQNPLDLVERKYQPFRVNGYFRPNNSYCHWSRNNELVHNLGVGFTWNVTPARNPPSADLSFWETKAMARANPGKPVVDVPLFVFELKDIPRMLLDVWKLKRILRRGGSIDTVAARNSPQWWLAYNMGWAPLMSDIGSLLTFASSWEERARYLNENRNKVIRVGLHSSQSEESVYGRVVFPLAYRSYTSSDLLTRRLSTKVWATYRLEWEGEDLPTDAFGDLSKSLGIGRLDPSTAWNAIPFSWMVDYFSNIGDVMQAKGGTIPYTLRDICTMATSVESFTGNAVTQYSTLRLSQLNAKFTRKQRACNSIAIARFRIEPLLTDKQASILGALAVTALLRR